MAFADKLSIDTPEQIGLEYEIAGPGSRFMALFLDLMLQAIAAIVLFFVLLAIGVPVGLLGRVKSNWALAAIFLCLFLVQWGYFAAFEIAWKGQTPGKRQAGIRVINESGRQISYYEALTRNLLRVIDSLPTGYALGAVVMFLSPQHKRIGDFVAGTIVVHDRKLDKDTMFFNTAETDVTDAVDYHALSAEDINLIETFLHRRLDLAPAVRRGTAAKLAGHFGEKCTVAQADRPDDENFLEILVRGFRRNARYEVPAGK